MNVDKPVWKNKNRVRKVVLAILKSVRCQCGVSSGASRAAGGEYVNCKSEKNGQ